MSGGTVSHNTGEMREWASKLEENSNYYTDLVENLYNSIDRLVSSNFRGELADSFEETVVSKRPDFERYASTFEETVNLINERASTIDDDTAYLKGKMQNDSVF